MLRTFGGLLRTVIVKGLLRIVKIVKRIVKDIRKSDKEIQQTLIKERMKRSSSVPSRMERAGITESQFEKITKETESSVGISPPTIMI